MAEGHERADVCVLGVGAMGGSCLYHLTRRGVRAVGVERFRIGHDRGSSHGETRIIRRAYFEEPRYLPLLERSYELWRALEDEAGETLLVTTGLLVAGPADAHTIAGLERCYAAAPWIPHERMGAREARRRYPELALPEGSVAYFDPTGGFLYVERAVESHARLALARGATIHEDEPALSWESRGHSVIVRTARRTIEAGALVLCPGAWAPRELTGLGVPFEVLRKVLLWFAVPAADGLARFGPGRLPAFFVETAGEQGGAPHAFYGFPALAPFGLKVAEHSFAAMGRQAHRVADAGAVERGLLPDDEGPVRAFVERCFPGLGPAPARTRHAVCMYTNTPDENFLVGRHPRWPNVFVAAGFSGHGFKMASAVGEALADLATGAAPLVDLGFLAPDRFPV